MKTIVAAAIGECVHVAVINFLRLAEEAGWRTVFLGLAVSPDLIEVARPGKGGDLVGFLID